MSYKLGFCLFFYLFGIFKIKFEIPTFGTYRNMNLAKMCLSNENVSKRAPKK